MGESDLLIWTQNDRENILKIYGRTIDSVKYDVQIIKVWMQQQKHLPAVLNDKEIERLLCINKFHFEKTKASADMYYSIRTIIPHLFLKDNVRNPIIQESWKKYYCFCLPYLFNNLRITVYKLIDFDASNYDGLTIISREMYAGIIRLSEDYDEGQIAVIDLQGYTLAHALKFTPGSIKVVAFIMENLYSNNLRGLHFLNAPKMAEYFIGLLKRYVAPKILNRIFIHKDLVSFQEKIPVWYLPVEMGGTEFSLKELNEKWRVKMESYYDFFVNLDNLRPDENLRPTKLKNNIENLFGMEGNFRKLNFD